MARRAQPPGRLEGEAGEPVPGKKWRHRPHWRGATGPCSTGRQSGSWSRRAAPGENALAVGVYDVALPIRVPLETPATLLTSQEARARCCQSSRGHRVSVLSRTPLVGRATTFPFVPAPPDDDDPRDRRAALARRTDSPRSASPTLPSSPPGHTSRSRWWRRRSPPSSSSVRSPRWSLPAASFGTTASPFMMSSSPSPSTWSPAMASPWATTACSLTAASVPCAPSASRSLSQDRLPWKGGVVAWVGTHRRHHAFADRPGDPHLTCARRGGPLGAGRGVVARAPGWLFDDVYPESGFSRMCDVIPICESSIGCSRSSSFSRWCSRSASAGP